MAILACGDILGLFSTLDIDAAGTTGAAVGGVEAVFVPVHPPRTVAAPIRAVRTTLEAATEIQD